MDRHSQPMVFEELPDEIARELARVHCEIVLKTMRWRFAPQTPQKDGCSDVLPLTDSVWDREKDGGFILSDVVANQVSYQGNSISTATIRGIETALARLASGEYFMCEFCKGDIDLRRLMAFPIVSYCLKCQREKGEMARKPQRTRARDGKDTFWLKPHASLLQRS